MVEGGGSWECTVESTGSCVTNSVYAAHEAGSFTMPNVLLERRFRRHIYAYTSTRRVIYNNVCCCAKNRLLSKHLIFTQPGHLNPICRLHANPLSK